MAPHQASGAGGQGDTAPIAVRFWELSWHFNAGSYRPFYTILKARCCETDEDNDLKNVAT